MGTNAHARERVKHDLTSPPAGRDQGTDSDHALQASNAGTSARKSTVKESKTRDEGRDDRRTGSDTNRN